MKMKKLEKYNVEPIYHGIPLSDPAISPDGKRILFTRRTTNDEEDKYDSHIWITSTQTGEVRQFTYGRGSDSKALWSPDGETVFFLSNRKVAGEDEEKTRLWAIPFYGGEARLAAEARSSIEGFELSPDGKKILFLSRIEEDSEARGDMDETDVLWIKKLIYKRNGVTKFFPYTRRHLFTINANGGEPKQITKGQFDVTSADWSPDGTRIAFVTNIDDCDHSSIRDVYVIPSDEGSPRKVTDSKIMIGTVSWSPDGKFIAYTGYEPFGPNFRGWKNSDIWVTPPEGGEVINLTTAFNRTIRLRARGPIWSADSKTLYFTAPNQGASNIYKVSLDTREVEPVSEGRWVASSFSMNKDSSIIAFDASETIWPAEIWIQDKHGTRRLTNVNADLMKDWKLSEPEEFWFESSDGVKVQGWIMKPLEFKEGEKYPTIIEVHGGPMGFYGYKLNQSFQILARHGYAVIYTNPRMSVGYGERFAAECSGHYGEKDFSDIMEAVDFVVDKYPFIDADRLGELGHSYGGFMTNWIVGHTDRFKACVTMASISNWDSFHGVSDIGTYWVPWQVGFGKNPWEARELHAEKSPITYVGNVTTPLLIMHPEKDYRCPLEQAEQLFVALKKMKKDVEFILFPDENHLLPASGKPSHRREWLRHILRWFDKYVK